jgi:hypothetical protein
MELVLHRQVEAQQHRTWRVNKALHGKKIMPNGKLDMVLGWSRIMAKQLMETRLQLVIVR